MWQAWRAVDRAYYDKSFNGQSWFRVRSQDPAVCRLFTWYPHAKFMRHMHMYSCTRYGSRCSRHVSMRVVVM